VSSVNQSRFLACTNARRSVLYAVTLATFSIALHKQMRDERPAPATITASGAVPPAVPEKDQVATTPKKEPLVV
jgi:hypothetical protein